jgi:hypothetical protein
MSRLLTEGETVKFKTGLYKGEVGKITEVTLINTGDVSNITGETTAKVLYKIKISEDKSWVVNHKDVKVV